MQIFYFVDITKEREIFIYIENLDLKCYGVTFQQIKVFALIEFV